MSFTDSLGWAGANERPNEAPFASELQRSFRRMTSVVLARFAPHPGVMPGGGWIFTRGSTFAHPPPPRAWTNGVYGSVPPELTPEALAIAGPSLNPPKTPSP